MKASIWKWLILIVVVATSLALVIPPKDKVKLGLDLQGGTSYTLQIDQSSLEPGTSLSDARDQAIEVVRNRVDKLGIAEPNIYPDGEARIVVQIPGMKAEDRERTANLIKTAAYLTFRIVHKNNDTLVKALFDNHKLPPNYEAVALSGPHAGDYWVRTVATSPDEAERAAIAAFEAKPGYELLLEKEVVDGKEYFRPWYVSIKPEVTGDQLTGASVSFGNMGERQVELSFDATGRRAFARVTKDLHPGGAKNPDPLGRRYIAIVLDDTLYSAPYVKDAIPSGKAVINGNFTLDEANDLATALRAGRLKAKIDIIEERTVDPTLGADSIASGEKAALIGLVGVLVFAVLYYHFAGLVASLALVLNLVLLPLGMIIVAGFYGLIGGASLGASVTTLPVLTLPGIAGIVLSIGMAVDANVLIYERIREEMKSGKRFVACLDAGYDKAFGTILDANITTLIAAVILFWLGSGPVKGFAITLSAGIVVSMYTAIMVTRMVFNFMESNGWLNKLGMFQWIPETRVDFLGKSRYAMILSLLLLIGTFGFAWTRGAANFGVDFTGGQQITLTFAQKVDVDQLRAAITDAGVENPGLIQYQSANVGGIEGAAAHEILALKVTTSEAGDAAIQALQQAFPESAFALREQNMVGPQVGKELQRSALLAIGIALLCMILYITIRFEFSFAVGAVVGLFHTVLLTLGLYLALHLQLTMTSIAAFLTVLGYAINDTIVVFDRIREARKLHNGQLNRDICNKAINDMLARTALTSITTLISLAALLVFGRGDIFDFAVAMSLGVVIGTYASVFIATPIMLAVRPRNTPAVAK
ncbi:MAG: protein translocase subunit SecD [Kiritimatiellae bacterium]|nr:protein translocase subunit SecD [Kiritimatiellia bacterium]